MKTFIKNHDLHKAEMQVFVPILISSLSVKQLHPEIWIKNNMSMTEHQFQEFYYNRMFSLSQMFRCIFRTLKGEYFLRILTTH